MFPENEASPLTCCEYRVVLRYRNLPKNATFLCRIILSSNDFHLRFFHFLMSLLYSYLFEQSLFTMSNRDSFSITHADRSPLTKTRPEECCYTIFLLERRTFNETMQTEWKLRKYLYYE